MKLLLINIFNNFLNKEKTISALNFKSLEKIMDIKKGKKIPIIQLNVMN